MPNASESGIARGRSDTPRIVVIEDSDDFADILATALGLRGYSVWHVRTLAEGRRMLEARPDLVLLDIMLPDGNGLEFLSEIRESCSLVDLPVILVSVLDRIEQVVKGFALGANDYVTKPFDLPVLLARVETQIALRRLTSARRSFLRIASHDLRSPLATVQSLIDALSDSLEPAVLDEDARRMLEAIRATSSQMLDVVDAFLGVETLDRGIPDLALDRVKLNEVARDVVERSRIQSRVKGIRIDLELEENLPLVPMDVHRIAQVIQNLVDNAVKFNASGAQVRVRTRATQEDIVLEVEDEGPGLTSEDLKHIFVQGAKLSNRPTGGEKSLSLGLWIARKLVLLHDGDIGARNNPERGVTFWFSLPRRSRVPVRG